MIDASTPDVVTRLVALMRANELVTFTVFDADAAFAIVMLTSAVVVTGVATPAEYDLTITV